jgi:hypothetical protein
LPALVQLVRVPVVDAARVSVDRCFLVVSLSGSVLLEYKTQKSETRNVSTSAFTTQLRTAQRHAGRAGGRAGGERCRAAPVRAPRWEAQSSGIALG